MNLYEVNIHNDYCTDIYGETFHVSAGSAKAALEKAYRKFYRLNKTAKSAVVHSLKLIEERW